MALRTPVPQNYHAPITIPQFSPFGNTAMGLRYAAHPKFQNFMASTIVKYVT